MPTKAIKQQFQGHYTKWAIYFLIAVAIISVAGRLLYSDQLRFPDGDSVWNVSIEAQLTNADKDDRIYLSPPWNTGQARVVSQTLQHTGLRLIRARTESAQKRSYTLQPTNEGNLSLYAEFTIHTSTTPKVYFAPSTKPLDAEKRALYLGSEDRIDLSSPDIARTLKEITENTHTNDELISRLYEYTRKNLVKTLSPEFDDAEVALRSNKATTIGRSSAMVALSRLAGIPARVISGFILEDAIEATPHNWLEVYNNDNWISFDPEKGHAEELPVNYIAFSRGKSQFISSKNMEKLSVTYNIEQNYDLANLNIKTQEHFLDIFDLNRFSPDSRSSLGLLILLPLGVLITAFCRNFLGIRAYGTFTPTLLALAAVYADWITALVLLIIVVVLGLSGRSAMPDQLTRIPRLAIVFTIVVMSMVLGVSVMEYFKINPGEHVVLLPIVILTSLIDRFYSTIDSDGFYIAIRRLVWTIIISLACFPFLKLKSLGAILLTYPEAHFITLALILMISMYSGKKLSEYTLFKWIREPVRKKKSTAVATEN